MKKLMICLLGLSLVWASAGYAKPAAAPQDQSQKLAEVEKAIADLKQQLNDIKVQRSELEKQLEKSETNINATMKRVEDIKQQIKATEGKAGALSDGKKK